MALAHPVEGYALTPGGIMAKVYEAWEGKKPLKAPPFLTKTPFRDLIGKLNLQHSYRRDIDPLESKLRDQSQG